MSPEEFLPARDLLESARRTTRPRVHDLYDVFRAIVHLLDTGIPWRAMPREFPPWRTVHEYYLQWTLQRPGEVTLLERALRLAGLPDTAERLRVLLNSKR